MLIRYEHIVNTSSDLMAFIDANYTYQAVNQRYLDAFRKTRDEVIGYTHVELFGAEYFENVMKPNIDACLAGASLNVERWYDYPGLGRRYMNINFNP